MEWIWKNHASQIRGCFYVDALEETELLCLEKNKLQKLYEKVPKFERFGRIIAENAYLGIRHRTKTLTNLNAEERYLTTHCIRF